MPSEKSIIEEGRAAWCRVKQATSLDDYIAIGKALLVGRRLCMKSVNAFEPRGVLYVKANRKWLEENGFYDMPKAARACCMLLAEHEKGVHKWIKSRPHKGRPVVNCQVTWRAYRLEVLKEQTDLGWRNRKQLNEKIGLQAWEDAKLAARDSARGQYVSAQTVDAIARAVFVATLNALDIAVPERLVRNLRRANSNGKSHPVSNMEALDEVVASLAR